MSKPDDIEKLLEVQKPDPQPKHRNDSSLIEKGARVVTQGNVDRSNPPGPAMPQQGGGSKDADKGNGNS
jgi:hypothetical protein